MDHQFTTSLDPELIADMKAAAKERGQLLKAYISRSLRRTTPHRTPEPKAKKPKTGRKELFLDDTMP